MGRRHPNSHHHIHSKRDAEEYIKSKGYIIDSAGEDSVGFHASGTKMVGPNQDIYAMRVSVSNKTGTLEITTS